jgi:hypothetical protein
MVLLHLPAFAGIVLCGLSIGLKCGLAVPVLASLAMSLNTHALRRGRRALQWLHWTPEGQWSAITSDGEWLDPGVPEVERFGPGLVVLSFSRPSRRTVLILSPDVRGRTFRQLRVRLDWGRSSGRGADNTLAGMR